MGRLLVLQTADGQPEEGVDRAHPGGVAQREVVVDRDQLAVAPGEGVEVERHGRDEGFAFAGGHFRDAAAVERDAAHELDVEGNHIPDLLLPAHFDFAADHAAAGVLHDGEGFTEEVVEGLAVGEALFELRSFRLKLLVGELLILHLQLVDPADQRKHFLEIALRFGAENGFQNLIQHLISTPGDRPAAPLCREDTLPAGRSATTV